MNETYETYNPPRTATLDGRPAHVTGKWVSEKGWLWYEVEDEKGWINPVRFDDGFLIFTRKETQDV